MATISRLSSPEPHQGEQEDVMDRVNARRRRIPPYRTWEDVVLARRRIEELSGLDIASSADQEELRELRMSESAYIAHAARRRVAAQLSDDDAKRLSLYEDQLAAEERHIRAYEHIVERLSSESRPCFIRFFEDTIVFRGYSRLHPELDDDHHHTVRKESGEMTVTIQNSSWTRQYARYFFTQVFRLRKRCEISGADW